MGQDTQEVSTPQDGQVEAQAFSLTGLFEARHGEAPLTETQEADPSVKESSQSGEAKQADIQASGTQQDEANKDETTQGESASPADAKLKKENYKLREQRRKDREEREKLAKELQALREQFGVQQEQTKAEADPKAQAELQVRVELSKERFIEEFGADVLEERITGEDAPWQEIVRQANEGDQKSMMLYQRAALAKDPFREADTILKEQALFEQYGTTNVVELVEKALAAHREALEQQLTDKLNKPKKETGKRVNTLGVSPNVSETSQSEFDAGEAPFSLVGLLGSR